MTSPGGVCLAGRHDAASASPSSARSAISSPTCSMALPATARMATPRSRASPRQKARAAPAFRSTATENKAQAINGEKRCPFCGHEDTQVKDPRPTDDNSAIRRRRYCPSCGSRFTTFERVQLRELTVIKKNGQRVAFDRDKLARSISVRPPQRRSRASNASSARSPSRKLGRERDPSTQIGELVMIAARPSTRSPMYDLPFGLSQFPRGPDFEEFISDLPRDGQPQGLTR